MHERGARWQAESGQVLLAFDKHGAGGGETPMVALPTRPAAGERPPRATSCRRRSKRSTSSAATSTRPIPERAESSYRQVLAQAPHHADAHINLGRILHERGDLPAAEEHYRRALAIRPQRRDRQLQSRGRAGGRRTARRRAGGLPARDRRRRTQRRRALQRRPTLRPAGRLRVGPAPPAHLPGPRAQTALTRQRELKCGAQRMRLPRPRPSVTFVHRPVSVPELSCRSILVVDDDPDVRDAVASVLVDEGYGVTSVGNGREALEHLQDHIRPSLILLDMMMPEMDGWLLRQELKKSPELASIPIVILSATATFATPRSRWGPSTTCASRCEWIACSRSPSATAARSS